MLMQVVYPLHHPVVGGSGEADEVPGLEMGHHVAQSHSSSMWTHGDSLYSH